ncbi:MAG: plasmid pRiA4b ORF-3 family protein [Alkalibacterium sp.]|nr:plasmid pRiA4b ORF-3 family protein [Alkalibacterium sp.]
MHIYLTKKLMSAFKKAEKILNDTVDTLEFTEKEDTTEPTDAFHQWHANSMKAEEHDLIVLTNDATGLTLIFLNPYEEDYLEFGDWVSEGLARLMLRMGLSEESVNDYFLKTESITASKASNPKLIGKNSASSQLVLTRLELIDEDDYFQESWSYKVNLMKLGENHFKNPIEGFLSEFGKEIEAPAYTVDVAEMEIRLKLFSQEDIIRIVHVPLNLTFDDLHDVIQTVFLWEKSHLHQFIMEDGTTIIGSENAFHSQRLYGETDQNTEIGSHYLLSDVVQRDENRVFNYVYDFGDFWEHTINVRKIWAVHKRTHPSLKMMIGDPAPENVGGPGGYALYQEAVNDPSHPEHEEWKEWARDYTSRKYLLNNVQMINSLLVNIY